MEQTLAMVLAGGKGKRMDVLCQERPKPILPFGGRFRVIDFSLSNCVHSDIGEIAVLSNYQRSRISGYLRDWYLNNAGCISLSILEPKPGFSYLGTADAIYQNLDYLESSDADTVLILAADHIYKMDYRKMLDFHRDAGADVTLGVVEVPIEDGYRFGIVETDSKNRIVDYVEKPENPRNNLASMGIYVFDKEALIYRIMEYGISRPSKHDLTYTVVPEILKHDKFYAYRFNGYWRDIGNVNAFYEANMEIINLQKHFKTDGKWPVLTGVNGNDQSAEPDNCDVTNSVIGPGCLIKGHVENSILSPGVIVDENAIVKDSVLMPEVSVGYHSVIEGCILDEKVNVGKFSYIGFGNDSPLENENITILGKGAVVPSGTAIGSNCKLMPYVCPEDIDSPVIASGSVIYCNSGTGEDRVQELTEVK